MKKRTTVEVESYQETNPQVGVRTGQIVRIDDDRRVWVDLADGRGAQPARLARAVARSFLALTEVPPTDVLVTVDGRGCPVVVDFVEDRIADPAPEVPGMLDGSTREEMVIDADRMIFDAKEQLVFRCGKATITLTRAGKVIIRGAYVSSTSSGVNRINGGSVQIN